MQRRPSRSPQRGPQPRQPSPSPQRPPQRQPSPGPGPGKPPKSGGTQPSQQQVHVNYLFDRPGEPVFWAKGDENAIFDVPAEYIEEQYRPARETIASRDPGTFGEVIKLAPIKLPNLGNITSLPKDANFSLFIPYHRDLAGRLISILMSYKTYDEFMSASVYIRDKVNPIMYTYALSVAILHRPDTKKLQPPPLNETYPDKYIDRAVMKKARASISILDTKDRIPLEIPRDFSASDADPEHRLAYFREDLGINLHHWHWHLVYPFAGPEQLVRKDRRGELFYYMHEQIVARYNAERLCNSMARVQRLSNFRNPIPEGYFSKLDTMVTARSWAPRQENAVLSDVYREVDQLKFDLTDLERWRDRILEAIAQAAILDPNGKRIELDETKGIDLLGDLVEASILTPNPNYYGNFHNFGHIAIALCHDPTGKHLETFGIMGDTATTMRDPIFYRWHAYIDSIFQQHKNSLPGYTEQVLSYPGIRIAGLEVVTQGHNKNELFTHWEKNDLNLSRGIDFSPRGNVFARITHLQHEPFTFRILIENSTGQNKAGTVRLFIAPKFDERGIPYQFVDHRTMFIELDRFPVALKNKQTTVERKSIESSVTIPFEATYRDLNKNRPTQLGSAADDFNFCGCGWPQNMLIPRGNAQGFPCVLFAMYSNIDGDRVEQPQGSATPKNYDDASSYCGIRDQKYPDRRNMGFPFDRPPRANVDTLRQFLTPNMAIADVRIVFQDRIQIGKTAT